MVNQANPGARQTTYWSSQLIVGGSDWNQSTGSRILLDGSGTNADITSSRFIANGAQGFSGANFVATGSFVGVNANLTGSITGVNGTLTGSLNVPLRSVTAGSPFGQGTVFNFTAETIISGGMWVTVSGAAGGASVLARAAAASTQGPIGVALATAASGATVSVLTQGTVYLTAEGTINNGVPFGMGAGGALNCALANAAGSGARGVALAGAGSNVVMLGYLF